MDRPDVAFLTWLQESWSATTAGITVADIDWQNNDWTDHQIQTGRPIIVVKMAGFRRDQPEENSLHRFLFMVMVGIHPKSQTETDAKRTLQWQIVDYLKGLMDGFTVGTISGWQYAYLNVGANVDAAVALPEDLITNLTVDACIAWTVATT